VSFRRVSVCNDTLEFASAATGTPHFRVALSRFDSAVWRSAIGDHRQSKGWFWS